MLTIYSCGESARSDQALSELARFVGIESEMVPIGEGAPAASQPRDGRPVLALGSKTLRKVFGKPWFKDAVESAGFVFVYGFVGDEGPAPELEWLTGGAFQSTAGVGKGQKRIEVLAEGAQGFPVAGKGYSAQPAGPGSTGTFFGGGAGASAAITIEGQPHLVLVTRGPTVRFLLAESEIVSIDQSLSPDQSLRPWYAQLISIVIFLRRAFGERCWTSPVTGATMIIDDPYLRPRYGFVRYETLLPDLKRVGGALTVAFIPYNFRRSERATVELTRQFPSQFSIAVHGCDHMGGEYASLDEEWLTGTTARAVERMKAHEAAMRMPYDNVMVFPQGRFSTKALKALAACGIEAAVNTEPWPVDYGNDPLSLRDHLDVAMTHYEGVPLFLRRYPGDMIDYAFDALFQKPILAVEHHAYFRNGFSSLASLVGDVLALGPKVRWMPLGGALENSYLYRRTGDGRGAVRHFMPTFVIKNPTAGTLELSVEKPEREGRVSSVNVAGREVPFEFHSGKLTYSIQLQPGEEAKVSVIYRIVPRAPRRTSLKYRLGVRLRRTLSDLRDNHLARNRHLLAFAIRAKNRLTGGGGSRDDAEES